jgi:hypothetical protein
MDGMVNAFIAGFCVLLAFVLYTWLMLSNLKMLRETKQTRLSARRKERSDRPPLKL